MLCNTNDGPLSSNITLCTNNFRIEFAINKNTAVTAYFCLLTFDTLLEKLSRRASLHVKRPTLSTFE